MSDSGYASRYEVVVLEDGRVVLQQVGEQEMDPLVTIRFSEQSRFFLGDAFSDVARKMIEAGLDAVSELQQPIVDESESLDEASIDADPILH